MLLNFYCFAIIEYSHNLIMNLTIVFWCFFFRRRFQRDVALQMITDDDANIPDTSDDENLSGEEDEIELDTVQPMFDSAVSSDENDDDDG